MPSPAPLSADETLQLVQSRGRSKEKLVVTKKGVSFAPVFGLTSVFMLSQPSMTSFARPLFDILAAVPELRDVLLLLTPDSYHMTLRGLEPCMFTTSTESLKALETNYRATFFGEPLGRRPASPTEPVSPKSAAIKRLGALPQVAVKMEDPFDRVGVILLVEPQGLLVEQLGIAQDATAQGLGLPPHQQEYHITVGYFVTEDNDKRRWAQQLVMREAKRLLKDAPVGLDPVHVCWYDSMERFTPMFH